MNIGEILHKKYKIVGILGQGGTAQVILAENIVLNNIWAVKVLSKDSPWISYQMEEVDILKRLSHPMLPRIADLFEDDDNYFIVMDYFSGSNLMELLQKEGKISEKVLIKWAFELLDALDYLHGRNPPVIYRDLKPSNLIVDDTGRLRLIDFGTARFHREEKCEDTIYIGTQGYAAPEQYGNGRSDQRTDLFNLGMTLVHLATGIHPLKIGSGRIGAFLRSSGISKGFAKFILGLVEPEPASRFQDARTACIALKKIEGSRRLIFNRSLRSHTSFSGVIGITSYLPGCGVTSLCFALGKYLTGTGKKAALVELNSSSDFNRLEKVLDNLGELKIRRENCFEADNMIFYPGMSDSGEISRRGVDIVILDLGQLNNEHKLREFNRTDIKLVICPRVPWKHSIFLEYDEGIRSQTKDEWIYVKDTSDNHYRQMHNKNIKHLVAYSLPKNPFYFTEEERKNTERFFKEICSIAETRQN
jgi:serine/threonine protein kinase